MLTISHCSVAENFKFCLLVKQVSCMPCVLDCLVHHLAPCMQSWLFRPDITAASSEIFRHYSERKLEKSVSDETRLVLFSTRCEALAAVQAIVIAIRRKLKKEYGDHQHRRGIVEFLYRTLNYILDSRCSFTMILIFVLFIWCTFQHLSFTHARTHIHQAYLRFIEFSNQTFCLFLQLCFLLF